MKVQGLGNQTAQEINPYTNFHPVQHPEYIFNKSREKYTRFNEQHPPLPLIDPSGNPVIESGVVEVKKVWQFKWSGTDKQAKEWSVFHSCLIEAFKEMNTPVRQAYQIVLVTNEADNQKGHYVKDHNGKEYFFTDSEMTEIKNKIKAEINFNEATQPIKPIREPDKLTIEELAPYLPYGLKIIYSNDNSVRELLLLDTSRGDYRHIFQPLLLPLTEAPMRLLEYYNFTDYASFEEYVIDRRIASLLMDELIEGHFDVFNLIGRGLAVNKLNYK